MSDFLQQRVTQVATVSSVATQAALKAITDRPVIFGAVANPYVIGAGTSPTKHRANVTGAEIPLPVDSAVVLAHEAFPSVNVWGTLFDPADPFAEFYLENAKAGAAAAGIQLITVACTGPGDIAAGIQALKAKGIVFRGMVALALRMGLNPIDLKLITAAFVLAALALPKLRFGRSITGTLS